MKRYLLTGIVVISMALAGIIGTAPMAAAAGVHVDGSAQMYAAFIKEGTEAFVKDTGVKAIAEQNTSEAGVKAIMKETCNVGAVARKLRLVEKSQDKTLVETLVAKDAISVYVDKANPVSEVSLGDLQKIFSGQITGWQDVGGASGTIQVAIPQTKTACNKNFRKAVMGDLGFAKSSVITEVASGTLAKVQGNPMAISFISYGAVVTRPDLKALKVGGKVPGDAEYPIIQELYFVTKGQPSGDIKSYIDYFLTGAGKGIIQKNGMFPVR